MRARVLTALALIPPVLAAVFCTSPWPIAGLLALVCVIGISEIVRLTRQALAAFGALLVVAGISAFAMQPFNHGGGRQWYPNIALGGVVFFVLSLVAIGFTNPQIKKSSPAALLFSGWILGPSASLFALHQSSQSNELWHFGTILILAIVPLWAGDTAAIFAGKAFGKHKLAPTISPKKTVEGGIANLIACVLAAWGLGSAVGIPLPQSLVCGLLAGVLGQAGDLFESWVKRRVDMKDSGTILPGHGGVLDRIDSILFTAPFVALILLFWK